jgi:sugar phosphate permease
MNFDGKRAPSPNPYRSWQVRIFAATWLAYAGYYFCRKAFYIVKADLADSLLLSPTDLAHLGTAYLVAYMVGQFSSAFFGRRLGPKLLLLVGMAISLSCNIAFGIANGFWTILLFLTLNGLAQGTGWPGCIGSLAFWFKRRQRGSVLGVWATCYQLGSVMAGSFAAFLLGLAGWRWSFFGASGVLLAVWFVVLLVHPNRPEDVGLDPIQDEEGEIMEKALQKAESDSPRGLGWSARVVTTILMMGAIYFCIKFLRYALWSWSPYFLHKNFGMAGDDAGYLSTVFDMAGFLGVLFAGFVSDRFFRGRRSLLSFLMLAMMTVSFAVMYLFGAKSVTVFAASMGVAGFMLYGPDSLLSGAGAIDVGSRQGALAAAGIINGMGSIGPVFQEQIIAWMYQTYDQRLGPVMFLLVSRKGVSDV